MTERPASAKKQAPDTSPLIDVVDDDPSVALGLSRLLRAWGMQVRLFGSGKEFLNARKEFPKADCCVIDVQMPEMMGWRFKKT